MNPRELGALMMLASIIACSRGEEPTWSATRRDSAGIVILEDAPPYPHRSVDPSPGLRIGVVDGAPEYQLSDVAYAARLSDGRLVVADGGSSEIRWYAADGTYRSGVGGPGEGPGEFLRFGSAVLTSEDTLVVYDPRNRRLAWLAPDESPVREQPLRLGPGSTVRLYTAGDDGIWIVEEQPTLSLQGSEFNYARDSVLVMRTSGTVAVDTVLRLPGRESATWVDYVDGEPRATRQFELPFGHATLVAGTSGGMATASSTTGELKILGRDGDLEVRSRRAGLGPMVVSDELRARYVDHATREAVAAGVPERMAREGAESRIALLAEEHTVPAYDRVLVDARDDRVWIRDYSPQWRAGEGREWSVYGPDGAVLARVVTPAGVRVMHVGPDRLVGLERDGLGVEYVVVHSLER